MTSVSITRICSGPCAQEKPLEAFSWRNRADGERQTRCKACFAEANRQSRARNLEKTRARDRAYHDANRAHRNAERRRRYEAEDPAARRVKRAAATFGITIEQYNEMLIRQDGVCAICRSEETRTRAGTIRALCVDHDHETGAVRGLLCGLCNCLLGYAQDDRTRLLAAVNYLKENE